VKDTDERQFLFATDLAMSSMNRSMLMKPTGNIDLDFVDVMVPNHQSATDMARAELKQGQNDALRQLAQRIVSLHEQKFSSLRHALLPAANLMPSTGAEIASHAPN
jgi:uncharacterized protein (DUF305 family)